jgi:hypothetical protein
VLINADHPLGDGMEHGRDANVAAPTVVTPPAVNDRFGAEVKRWLRFDLKKIVKSIPGRREIRPWTEDKCYNFNQPRRSWGAVNGVSL